MSNKLQQEVRRLRYRLKRQGMLELDEWLAPLQAILDSGNPEVVAAIDQLLEQEPADLLAVMQGRIMPPECLRDVLVIKPPGCQQECFPYSERKSQ